MWLWWLGILCDGHPFTSDPGIILVTDVVDGIMRCWETTDGCIHSAAGDQSRGWCAPRMVEEPGTGVWTPDPGVTPPSRRSTRATGPGGMDETDSDEPDSEDDITDLTGCMAEQPDCLTYETATVTTAERTVNGRL